MNNNEYIAMLRNYLCDHTGKIWDNSELTSFLVSAAENYCVDSELYHNSCNVFIDSSGEAQIPDDYIAFLAGWNSQGEQITPTSPEGLVFAYGDYSSLKGNAKYIYEDLSTNGKFRFVPNPFTETDTLPTVHIPSPWYGIKVSQNYGIPVIDNKRGIFISYTVSEGRVQANCEIVYISQKPYTEILDYMAIVYNVLFQAYSVDSEFKDLNKAQFFLNQYQMRIKRSVQNNVSSYSFNCKFY